MNAHTMKHQHGSVLIVGLLLLMVLTLLGVTAMSNMTMEERMASAYQKMDLAFESGETALADSFEAIKADTNAAGKVMFDSCKTEVPRSTRTFEANFIEHTPGIEIEAKLSTNYLGANHDITKMRGEDLGTDGRQEQVVDIISDTTVRAAGRVAARSVQVQTVKLLGFGVGCDHLAPE